MNLDKKKKIIIGCAGAVLIALLIFIPVTIKSCSSKTSLKNKYNLAKVYAERGEYDRALSLLDTILVKNSEDEIALDMLNQIVEMKKAASEGRTVEGFTNLKLDTSEFADTMQDTLSTMQKALEESNKQNEENRKAMENMLKMQEESSKAEADRRKEEENRRQKVEAEEKARAVKEAEEKKTREAALAEQKRQAEEKRKAEEAEIAKKNEKLKKQLNDVNEEIQKGETALATGNFEEAMKHFNKANSIMPSEAGKDLIAAKESEIAESLYEAAQKAATPEEKERLLAEAVAMANKAVKDNPQDATSHYILAQDAIGRKDYDNAMSHLKSAIQNDPENAIYYYDLGKVQYSIKKYGEAAASFNSCCQKNSNYAPARYNLGLCQLKLKNDKAALEAFRKAIDIDPRHEKAHLEEARILSRRGDYPGSIAAYEKVLSINNMNITALKELGNVYYQNQKFDKAEESYRKALAMMSESEEQILTKYNLSTVLYDAGKLADSEKYAKEAYENYSLVKNDKSKASIIYNYALLFDSKSDIDSAIPLYMEVLKYNPEHIKTKINLGVMYMNLDPPDVDTAMNLFNQVYAKDKNNFEVNNNLGSAYLAKEDFKNAIIYFQNALKIEPSNNAVRFNLANAYAKNSDYDNAKVVYMEVVKADLNNWDAYLELAKVLLQLNDNKGAEKYLIYLQEKNPSYKSLEVENLLSSLK